MCSRGFNAFPSYDTCCARQRGNIGFHPEGCTNLNATVGVAPAAAVLCGVRNQIPPGGLHHLNASVSTSCSLSLTGKRRLLMAVCRSCAAAESFPSCLPSRRLAVPTLPLPAAHLLGGGHLPPHPDLQADQRIRHLQPQLVRERGAGNAACSRCLLQAGSRAWELLQRQGQGYTPPLVSAHCPPCNQLLPCTPAPHPPSSFPSRRGQWKTEAECCRPGAGHADGCSKPEPCWIADGYWPARTCGKTEDQAICTRGWGAFASEDDCCAAGGAFSDGCGQVAE